MKNQTSLLSQVQLGEYKCGMHLVVPGEPAKRTLNILTNFEPIDLSKMLEELGYFGSVIFTDGYGNGRLMTSNKIDLIFTGDSMRSEVNWLGKCRVIANKYNAPVCPEFLLGQHYTGNSNIKECFKVFLEENFPLTQNSFKDDDSNFRKPTKEEMGWMSKNLLSNLQWSPKTRYFLNTEYGLVVKNNEYWKTGGYPLSEDELAEENTGVRPANLADLLEIFIRVASDVLFFYPPAVINVQDKTERANALFEIKYNLQQLGYLPKPQINRGFEKKVIPGEPLSNEIIKNYLQFSANKFKSIQIFFEEDFIELRSPDYSEDYENQGSIWHDIYDLKMMDTWIHSRENSKPLYTEFGHFAFHSRSGSASGSPKTLDEVEQNSNSIVYCSKKGNKRVRISRDLVERFIWLEETERIPHLAYSILFEEAGYYGCTRIPIQVIWS
jgi:hypothetical protein